MSNNTIQSIADGTNKQALRDVLTGLMNCSFVSALLAEGTNAATIKTVTNTVVYRINGQLYTLAPTDNLAITAGPIQAVSTFCKYLVTVDSGGTVTTTPGNQAATSALALLADQPADEAVLGYFEIATDATHTYTPGTTDNGAAGITDTYVNLSSVVTA